MFLCLKLISATESRPTQLLKSTVSLVRKESVRKTPTAAMEALQASSESQQTPQRDVTRLGENLGRLKARLTAEVEDIAREVDTGEHSMLEFAEFRETLDEC